MANAVTNALNEGWSLPNVQDVLVAIPVKMMPGTVPDPADTQNLVVNRPYGDRQTNAHVTFGSAGAKKSPNWWQASSFKSSAPLLHFRFHPTPHKPVTRLKSTTTELPESRFCSGSKTGDGDLIFDWSPATAMRWGSLFENKIAFVRIVGSKTWFPLDFRNALIANADLLSAIPDSMKNFGKGTLDPEALSVQGKQTTAYPFQAMNPQIQAMNPQTFPTDLSARIFSPVTPPGIHSNYYDPSGKEYVTAVGDGATYLFDSPEMDPPGKAPFKMAYICFDKRNTEAEKIGAPSGGGWHEIGDPAETVINSLENSLVIFGYANGVPAAKTPDGDFDHGLTDIAVVRRVPPGFAIVTAAGPTSFQEEQANRANVSFVRPTFLKKVGRTILA